MNPERWQQITHIFEAALRRDAAKRPAFLAEACSGDGALRREVEAMLTSHEKAGDFIEVPAMLVAARQGSSGASLTGQTIAHYQVLSLLGSGGMGDVYLALDTKLGRKVALKLLPEYLAGDTQRARLFIKEARAASALNHPNIITVYEIGQLGEQYYIAMEYVDGETLREQMRRERTPLPKLLKYLQQVAEGLTKAHAAGIVHRDLKPDNIMITLDGYAKVLDFGLAKLTGLRTADFEIRNEAAKTLTPSLLSNTQSAGVNPSSTSPGMVMGTAGYMSPEQALGREVDGRADIWSLGVVLYEMVTGRLPFEAETASDTIAALLRSEPPPLVLNGPEAPVGLEQIVTKALKKDREQRYQNVQDLALDLKSLRRELNRGQGAEFSDTPDRHGPSVDTARKPPAHTASSIGAVASRLRRHQKAVAVALGVTVIVALLLALFAGLRFFDTKLAHSPKQSAAPPNLKITRLTPDLHALGTGFTPDGKAFIYVQTDKGKQSIWLKDLGTGAATQILPPDDGAYEEPQFSRDGKWIYYGTARPNKPNRTLVRVPFAGGTMEEIALNVISPFTFSPNDRQIVFINGDTGDLHIVNADGGGERVLAKHDAKQGWFESWGSNMSWSPVHNLIAICGGRYGADSKPHHKLLLINPANGAEQVVPTPEWNYLDDVRWLGDGSGFIVCARETEASPYQVWHVAYPDGTTRRITTDLDDYTNLVLSPDSRRILTNRRLAHLNLWLAQRDALERARQISFGIAAEDGMWGLAFTPAGKIIYSSPRGGAVDLWQMNADGGEQKQLTRNAGELNAQPRLTPDGKTIVFVSTHSGRSQIWRMDVDGGNLKQLTDEFSATEPALSPDGGQIYFKIDDSDKAYIARIPLDGGPPTRVSKTPHNRLGAPLVSPDGKSIFCQFYDRSSSSPWKTGIMNAETGELIRVFDFSISGTAVWTMDSKALIYSQRHNANLWRVSIEGDAKPQQLSNFESGEIKTFAVSPDFKQFVISRGTATYEAVLLETF